MNFWIEVISLSFNLPRTVNLELPSLRTKNFAEPGSVSSSLLACTCIHSTTQ